MTENDGTPGGEPVETDFAITLGAARWRNTGTTKRIRSLKELRAVLVDHRGSEAWVIAAEFAAGQRTKDRWLRSSALVVDIDHKTKAVPTEEERKRLAEVAEELRATLWHDTPHGLRLWFVLKAPCNDEQQFAAAASHLCDRVDAELQGTNLVVDRGASCNCAQFMWTPNATVNDHQRSADVGLRDDLHDIVGFLPAGWTARDGSLGVRPDPETRGQRPFAVLEDAVAAYRQKHSIDSEMGGGNYDSLNRKRTNLSCPICRHHGCASRNLEAPNHAYCFSSNHEKDGDGHGIKMPGGFMFDVVDIHAHKAGLEREDFLRLAGWFDPSAAFERLDSGDNGTAAALRKHRLQLVTSADLAARPRMPDLWKRMLPVRSLAIWYGAPKCGKTYLALALGIAIAEGKPFLDRDTIVELIAGEGADQGDALKHVPRKGMVIYICGEGTGGVADKIAATIGVDRATNPADAFHENFKILPGMPNLTNRGDAHMVLGEIGKLGVQVDLIIVDTVARALGAAGLDENSTEDMGRFVAALDHLREQTGAAVLGIHHAGKSGVDRGSSALRGAADMFAKVERVAPRVSRFIVEDMRDGEPPEPIEVSFEQRQVGFDAHGPVERWVVSGAHTTGNQDDDVASGGHPAKLDAMRKAIRDRQAAGDSTRRLDLEKALSISKPEALRRLSTLKQSGAVKQVGHGRNAHYVESLPTQKHESKHESKEVSFDSSRLGGLQTPSQSRNPHAARGRPHPPAASPEPEQASTRTPLPPRASATPPTMELSADLEAGLRELLGDAYRELPPP